MQTSLNFDSVNHRYESNNNRHNLVANEFVLSYKKSDRVKSINDSVLNKPYRIAEFLRKIWDPNRIDYQESFFVLYLNSAMTLTGFMKIADGTSDAVPVDMKLVFTSALLSGAKNIILAHNHPSGTLKPSTADKVLTEKAVAAGKLLDVNVVDHIIMTRESYFSFAGDGMM